MSGGWITRAHEANQQERIDTELHPWPSCILISDTAEGRSFSTHCRVKYRRSSFFRRQRYHSMYVKVILFMTELEARLL